MTKEQEFRKQTEEAKFEAFSFMCKKVAELEQKLEQAEKDLADYQFNYPNIKELEKENAELKLKLEALERQTPWKDIKDKSEVIGQLAKAKEIIDKLLSRLNRLTYTGLNCEECKEAEQFLNSEVEK